MEALLTLMVYYLFCINNFKHYTMERKQVFHPVWCLEGKTGKRKENAKYRANLSTNMVKVAVWIYIINWFLLLMPLLINDVLILCAAYKISFHWQRPLTTGILVLCHSGFRVTCPVLVALWLVAYYLRSAKCEWCRFSDMWIAAATSQFASGDH